MNAQECYEKSKAYHDNGQYARSQEYLQKARQLASVELPDVTPRKAVVFLAKKTYEFFEQEYNNSNEIRGIIKTYSELLATVHIETLKYRDTTDEVITNIIKPLELSDYELVSWLCTALQSSLKKKFPNHFYYIYQAFKPYGDDTSVSEKHGEIVMANITKELSNILMLVFVNELFRSIKEHYERVFQRDCPDEYRWLFTDKDKLSELWNELRGRAAMIMADCFKFMGIDIPLIDMEKIIFGDLDIVGEGADININKSIVFGPGGIKVKVTTKEED